MLAATVHRSPGEVACRGHRDWLRARVLVGGGGLQVDSGHVEDGRWQRVDQDLVQLTRAITRLMTLDPRAARTFVAHAADLAEVPAREGNPVPGLLRATYPLLASPHPWPLAPIPAVIPAEFQPAFRARRPREASQCLFGDRTTRPLVRALSEVLMVPPTGDLFLVSLAVVAAPVLEPDHLVRVLDCRVTASCDRSPLAPGEMARLRDLLEHTPPRHVVRLLSDAARDPASRRRLRFVASQCPANVDLDTTTGWADLALAVLLAEPEGPHDS